MLTTLSDKMNRFLNLARAKNLWNRASSPVHIVVVTLLYLLLPNLLPLLSTEWLGAFPHGYINLEYLMIGAVGFFLPRGVVFVLLVLESLSDFAYAVCYTYQFSPQYLLLSLRDLFVLPPVRLLEGLGCLLLVLLMCAILSICRPDLKIRFKTARVLVVLTLTLFVFDSLSGRNPLWHRFDVAVISFRVTRVPILTLGSRELHAYLNHSRLGQTENHPMASASAAVISLLNSRSTSQLSPDVVLIVVESWGLPLDTHLAQSLDAPYNDPRLAQKYNVSYGTAPFTGLTVPGEARELCHSTIGFGILRATPELAQQCLPAYFHTRGYKNLSFHGYLGRMFFRSTWYPVLGFDHSWFRTSMLDSGFPICRGALPGICDSSIAGYIGSQFLDKQHQQPQFIYWVTLNSHLPEPEHPDLTDDSVCSTQPDLQSSAALCSWFRLVRNVHQSVVQTALGPTSRPTVFLLVGDHAPPFGNPQLRADFSSTEVPYVMLTPKAMQTR